MSINTRVGFKTGYDKKCYIHHKWNSNLPSSQSRSGGKQETQRNESTWSEYHTQHTITDSPSFTTAKSKAALWHKLEYPHSCGTWEGNDRTHFTTVE